MENILVKFDEKKLSKEAVNLLRRIQRRYGNFKLHKYVNWCIIKGIDVKISSEIIIQYINIIHNENRATCNITDELLNHLKSIINKKYINKREENKAYEIMSDIAFIIENSYTNNQDNMKLENEGFFFNFFRWIKKILKIIK
ncbi:hypothetical protein [Clostridium sp. UBA4548]|uniref:hypothetical protein n=1 Tax=Clostridium sp. UBA4548 TaxID=1946361 RepID=UPI0025C507D0|nr:hypothetical protein [Clostridium sp. UBA4548]